MIPDIRQLETEFASITEYWSPKVIAQVNSQYVKLAKLKGEFVWHDHADEDELFFIVKGELEMQYETGSVTLSQGAVHVVPKGVRHNPVAADECWVMLVEPVETKHTGDIIADKTRSIEEQLGQSGRA